MTDTGKTLGAMLAEAIAQEQQRQEDARARERAEEKLREAEMLAKLAVILKEWVEAFKAETREEILAGRRVEVQSVYKGKLFCANSLYLAINAGLHGAQPHAAILRDLIEWGEKNDLTIEMTDHSRNLESWFSVRVLPTRDARRRKD